MVKVIKFLFRKKDEVNLTLWTVMLFLMIVLVLMLTIGNSHAQTKTSVLIFSQGQEPTVSKIPPFALIGTRPLTADDRILEADHYSATGKNIYQQIIACHQKAYLKHKWNPAKMRMLVVVKNVNRGFSTSGSVSLNNTESTQENKATGMLSKYASSNLTNSGSIAPSFYQNWSDQRFIIHFFLVE